MKRDNTARDPSFVPCTVKAARAMARTLGWGKVPARHVVAVRSDDLVRGEEVLVTGGTAEGSVTLSAFSVSAMGPGAHTAKGQALIDAVGRAGLAMGYRTVETDYAAPGDLLRRAGWVRDSGSIELPDGGYVRRAEGRLGDLRAVPLLQAEANEVVDRLHSHHGAPQGSMWSVGIVGRDGVVHCVAQVGIARARMLMSPRTAEVVRVASDGTKNAASMALARCTAALFALGYTRVVSYTILGESGHSYRVAGWWPTSLSAGGQWSRPSRARAAAQQALPKVRWEIGPGAPKPSAAEAQRLAEVIRSSVGAVQIPTRR